MIFWFWFLIFCRSTRFRQLQMHPSKVILEFLGWLLWYFGFHFLSINPLPNYEKYKLWKNRRKQNKAEFISLDTYPQSMVFLRIHFQHRACGTTSLWLFKFQMSLLLLKNMEVNNYNKPPKKPPKPTRKTKQNHTENQTKNPQPEQYITSLVSSAINRL